MKNIMQQAMQHDVAWDYEENRRKIHEILDIVLDTNTLEGRNIEKTGTLPAGCFRFSGICGKILAEIYPDGWCAGAASDCVEFTFNTDAEISQRAIDAMQRECEAALEGKSGVEAAQRRIQRLDREIQERQEEMDQLGTYIKKQQSGGAVESGHEDLQELEIEEADE